MRTAKAALALFAFWCVVVPPHAAADLVVGALVALAAALWTRRLWGADDAPLFSVLRPRLVPRFALAMARRVAVSAFEVLRLVLDPRLPIAPATIRHTVVFAREAARVTYANAITITPGTLTVDVEGDTFVVHCLSPSLAGDVTSGRLAGEVARLFGDPTLGAAR